MSEVQVMTADRALGQTRLGRAGAVAAIVSGALGLAITLVPVASLAIGYRQAVLGPLLATEHLLFLAPLATLWASRACGDGWFGKGGLVAAFFATLVWASAEVMVWFWRTPAEALFGIGVPLFGVAMIVAGIAMLRARRWSGWHRFVPLAIGLYIPLVLVPALVLKVERELAIGLWGIGFVLLGIAMLSEATRPFQIDAGDLEGKP